MSYKVKEFFGGVLIFIFIMSLVVIGMIADHKSHYELWNRLKACEAELPRSQKCELVAKPTGDF